jgi:lysylphosphatidylglycerol synthetase-like protein (DUF2156 family)
LFLALVVVLAAVFVIANRAEIPAAERAARDAHAAYLILATALSLAYLAAYSGLIRSSLKAVGYGISWRRAALLGPAVHFSNMSIVNSGGLGGMPLLVADARRSRQPVSAAVLAYFVAAQLGHLVFAVVLVAAVVVAAIAGELARVELAAAAVFGVYTLTTVAVMATALRSQRVFFWLHSAPIRAWRLVGRLLGRPARGAPAKEPRELFESIQALARNPRAFAKPVGFAAAIEVIGVSTLWAALAAFGQGRGLTTPLIGYSAGVVFSAVGFLPAGLGFAEAGLGLALSRGGVAGASIALVVVTYRVFEAWVPFALGAVAAHRLSSGERSPETAPRRPGIGGARRRRLAAGAVVALGTLNILLAALRHPLIRLGPIHEQLPHAAVQSSRYVLLAAGVALIASAAGLLHGKRQAWLIAVVAIVGALVAHPFKRVDFVGIAVNAGVLFLLVSFAGLFPARSDPARARRGAVWLIFGELGVLVYGVLGLYFLDRQFVQQTTALDSFEDGLRLLFVLPATTIEPATRHGAWFIDSVRAGAIVIFLVGAFYLLQPVIHRVGAGRDERRRVEDLLERYATSAIAYFHLLGDKSYFFAAEGTAFIGYRVVGHTAVALGEPIGDPAGRRAVTAEFAEFCDLNAWAFCFHQVTEGGAAELRTAGLQALKIGEEAVVPLQAFSLAGKSFKHLRNTVHRLERDGFTFEVLRAPIGEPALAELEEVSDAWLRDGSHRERAFSLGAFTRAYAGICDVAIVRAPSGRIEAFANLIPSYNSGQGNFDMMRRRTDAPDGAMDFLFVGLIGHFRRRGLSGMNLGLAPLANIQGSGVVPAALRLLYARAGGAFNFQGLRAYKEKWKPAWEPRYLVYRSDVQLPAMAIAVARAGERSGRLPISFGGHREHKAPPALVPEQ